MSKDEDSFENESADYLKYLLGESGIDIFLAIDRGAKNFKTIQIFTGCSISCIKGRIPVLLELDLISKNNNNYVLTEKGIDFKKEIKNET